MPEPIDLELSLHRKDATHYGVELVVTQPESEAPVAPLGQHPITVSFDSETLLAAWSAGGPEDYGRALGAMLFADPALLEAFAEVRAVAASMGLPLRLRLAIAADAPELHVLRWETLIVPGDTLPLAQQERALFARALGSPDWQPVTLRARADLRALVAIAAPDNLQQYGLAPIDAAAEAARASTTLASIPTTVLAAPGAATLTGIVTALREGYDLLYLVAHGALVKGEPWVFLEDDRGHTARIDGRMLVALLKDLPVRPRLALLASCEGAGDGTLDALAALGPRLITAGIPAVIAMQGRFSLDTNRRFVPAFIQELQHDGRIDRALAVARQQVRERSDWWMPALFTRLRSGRIWYERGLDAQGFQKWPALVNSIVQGKCTPILGPGLLEGLIGSTRDLARRLAEKYHFPLAPNARDDLPQVAQYLAVNQSVDFVRDELAATLREQIAARSGVAPTPGSLDDQLAEARQRVASGAEPHSILASLPLKIYLTANPDRLLADALVEAGKRPQVRICPWNRASERDALKQEPLAPLTSEAPLVYHLFGRFDEPETLVLTEDDYFRYLIGVTRNEELFPKEVGSALVNTSLLFIGFRLEDWNFRVLFQSVMNLAGAELRWRHTHVAVQIDPQEGAVLDPQAARKYLETYFGEASALQYRTNISIYWGSAEDFLRDLFPRVAQQLGVPLPSSRDHGQITETETYIDISGLRFPKKNL